MGTFTLYETILSITLAGFS